jgi:hypothetical protein
VSSYPSLLSSPSWLSGPEWTCFSRQVAATLRTQDFVHIPGPNPILTVGGNGTV